ncbi:hypothetical protein V1477_011419 [Vespula maculifrons]|uniref:Uncharacterized protein n=1 Tax=Vespula maculifrons TaxID=7453 RepID=A0ABD2BZ96_VESMC
MSGTPAIGWRMIVLNTGDKHGTIEDVKKQEKNKKQVVMVNTDDKGRSKKKEEKRVCGRNRKMGSIRMRC